MSLNSCEHVSRRVQKTKKEIEQLKEELQKLINRGTTTQSESEYRNETVKSLQNDEKTSQAKKAQTSLQPHLTSAQTSSLRNITFRSNLSTQQSDDKKQEPTKKVRHYNVEDAREYIRKQKEKRLNKIKSEVKDSRTVVDLRKEKLRELRKKSLELVQKNINLKRERSRSRDKGKSENHCKNDKKENIANQTTDKSEKLKSNKINENCPKSNTKIIETENEQNLQKQDETKDIMANPPINKNSVPDLIVNNFKHIDDNIPQFHNQQDYIQKSKLDKEDAAIRIQRFYRKYRQKRIKRNIKNVATHHELITHFRNVPCEVKNAQSSFDVPVWLTPKVESYPYNFINTVKRKLNFAINNHTHNKDVGIQIDSNESKEQAFKIKEDLKRSLEESKRKEKEKNAHDLFLSKAIDLDLRKVENLHLLDNKDCDRKHSISDSESDTSKNIPDISTESGSKNSIKTLSDIKTSPNLKVQINIDKIKDLKLEEKSLSQSEMSCEMDLVRKFSSKSAENITKRSKHTTKSRSASSITGTKEVKKKPSPLHVPNINLIVSEPPSETATTDLKSLLDYMSNLEYKKHSKSKTDSFRSLPHSTTKSDSVKTELSAKSNRKSDGNADSYSTSFSASASSMSTVPSLKRPTVTLSTSQKGNENTMPEVISNYSQVSIKPGEVKCIETKSNTNQIHLKFEAELHLLNDFNESLRQFMAVEKTILDLHSKNQSNTTILQNQDTQTSVQMEEDLPLGEESIATSIAEDELIPGSKDPTVPSINYTRGSDIGQEFSQLIKEDMGSTRLKKERSLVSVSLDLSQLDDTINSTVNESISNVSVKSNESYSKNVFAGFSVGMFDQLIRDEDTRIENLKTILKIREKALLDRTKGELAWLEIQKKQLIETGQLHEASLLKKKQRGIIIKLQHEKQEMQRLKQIQKQASKERKTVLKEQRNMIKAQLSNNYTIPKIKRSSQKERRQSGPIKVYNLHRETINTETSISRRNSAAEEIVITSRSESVVGQITEDCSADQDSLFNSSTKSILGKGAEDAKKSLLMREAALQKRKKAAEDLLRWHQRLLEEERKIAELEMAANTIIKQAPSIINKQENNEDNKFKGSQLNLLWLNITGNNEKKYNESEYYTLSPMALEKFCKEAKKAAIKTNRIKHSSDTSIASEDSIETKHSKKSTETNHSTRSDKTVPADNSYNTKENSYTPDFESQILEITTNELPTKKQIKTGVLENEIDKSKSTLNEIMQNISNITDEISAIYKLSTVGNVNEHSMANESPKTTEVSVQVQSKPVGDPIINVSSDLSVELETNNQSVSNEHKISDKNSNFKNLDDQINEILSEGSKRISDILNSRKFSKEEANIKTTSSDKNEMLSENVRTVNGIGKTNSEIISENHINSVKIPTESSESTVSSDMSLESKSSEIESDIINENHSENQKSISTLIKLLDDSEFIKTKSISVTVLKSNEIPKSNSLSSSVTLVKNLTQSIKTGTENVYTPEPKNIHYDSPGTLNCNGELLSTSNEQKVETNDCSQNTSNEQCQIADIFSGRLAVQDGDLETDTEKAVVITEPEHVNLRERSNNDSINDNKYEIIFNSSKTENDKDICADNVSTNNSLKLPSMSEDIFKDLRFENNALIDRSITENCLSINSNEKNKLHNGIPHFLPLKVENETFFANNVEKSQSEKDESKILNNKQIELENFISKTESIFEKDKSSTLNNISSIKEDDSLSNASQTSKRIIFKPLKTIDEPSSNKLLLTDSSKSSNYSTHNGHDEKWEEEIVTLQNKFKSLTSSNQHDAQSKIIPEHSEKSDTLEAINDIESTLSDNKEVTTEQSSNKTKEDTNKVLESNSTQMGTMNKTAIEDETSMNISITELSECEEFQDNKDSNDRQINTTGFDNTNQSLSEQLSVNAQAKDVEISEMKPVKKTELKSIETNKRELVEKAEIHSENRSKCKEPLELKSKTTGDATDFVDVKKRVSEILADANSPRGDKSPRLQDIYTTTYDIISPERSPEMGSPVSNEKDLASVTQMYGEEAEALFKKQLAIEQEIKQLEQQQKEQIPYMYMREIPNKPPPPYTPPVSQSHTSSVVPTSTEQLDVIVCNIARILHNSYYKGTLETTVLTDRDKRTFSLRNSNIDKESYEYVFDLCKELTLEHYQQFVEKPKPPWLRISKKQLAQRKPFNELELRQHLFKEIKLLLGFEKDLLKESVISKWCRKKRDHVDEILIVESQAEESEWTNYDEDEVLVKDELTNDIMKILIADTAQVLNKVLKKRLTQCPS